MEERIACSAILIKGLNATYDGMHLGLRHSDCFAVIARIRATVDATDNMRIECLRHATQGFMTTKGRFVTREEGMKIAIGKDQIIAKHGKGEKLYSECLY